MNQILINCRASEKRAVWLKNGELQKIILDKPNAASLIGNIYKGKVVKVVKGLQAAFVDIGIGQNAFLQKEELFAYKNNHNSCISSMVHEGKWLNVQVLTDGVGNKGPKLSEEISLSGSYVVYLPFGNYVGVSKKITGKERLELKSLGELLCENDEGIIFRTSSINVTIDELTSELNFLRKQWKSIQSSTQVVNRPALTFYNQGIIERLIREFPIGQINEIVVDHLPTYEKLKESIKHGPNLTYYKEKQDLFFTYHVEKELDKLLMPKVWLKNGANLLIEMTEAFTVIDVNSSKFTGKGDKEDTIVKTNEEAAREIAKQIRLRQIGGIILIDFINMRQDESRKRVMNVFIQALREDQATTKVFGFTQLGLLEMTRKKEGHSLLQQMMDRCGECQGQGYKLSESAHFSNLERTLLEYKGIDEEAVWLELSSSLYSYIIEHHLLNVLEGHIHCEIFITTGKTNSFVVKRLGTKNDIRKLVNEAKCI